MEETTKENEGILKLETLQRVLKNVYLPLEDKVQVDKNVQTKQLLKKFVEGIEHTLAQLKGTIEIEIPQDIQPDEELALEDRAEIQKYESHIVSFGYPWFS